MLEPPDSTIVAAAISTIRNRGIAGTTRAAIAHTGGFDPEVIDARFGSLDELLVQAARTERERLAASFADHLGEVGSLPHLAQVASDLHADHAHARGMGVLAQLMAGSASSPALRSGVHEGFEPWIDLVRDTVDRVLADTALDGLVPHRDLAYAVAALFLGVELISALDDDTTREDSVYRTLASLAILGDRLLNPPIPGARAVTGRLARRALDGRGARGGAG